jgi:hypothetical protein
MHCCKQSETTRYLTIHPFVLFCSHRILYKVVRSPRVAACWIQPKIVEFYCTGYSGFWRDRLWEDNPAASVCLGGGDRGWARCGLQHHLHSTTPNFCYVSGCSCGSWEGRCLRTECRLPDSSWSQTVCPDTSSFLHHWSAASASCTLFLFALLQTFLLCWQYCGHSICGVHVNWYGRLLHSYDTLCIAPSKMSFVGWLT